MEDSVVCTSSSTLGTSTPVSEPVLPVIPVAEPVLPVLPVLPVELPVELPVSSSLSLSSSASSDVAGQITLGAAGPLLPTAGPLLFFLALAPPWLLGLAFVKLCTRGNRPRLDHIIMDVVLVYPYMVVLYASSSIKDDHHGCGGAGTGFRGKHDFSAMSR